MTGLTAVTDANTVIALAKGGVFELLAQLFTELYVPPSVVVEVVLKGQGRPGAAELAGALGNWVTEQAPVPAPVHQFSSSLSVADREVLAIAQAAPTHTILTDDRALRREANRLQIPCLGVPEVVVLLKDQGLIPQVRTVLDRMLQAREGIAPDVYEQALRTAGEWPPS